MKIIWICLVGTITFWKLNLVHTLPKPNHNDNCTSSTSHAETLLDIARNGLPKTSEPKHVIIIGAGIAGLTAAKLLKDAGHKVTILEASDRIGGRIYTYRDQEDRYYVELGAMRIYNSDKFVNIFVKHFNLPTNDFISYNGNTWYYINGKKIRTSIVAENPDVLGFNTSRREKGKSSLQLITEAMKTIVDDCERCGEMDLDCLTSYDHYNNQEYFVEVGGLSRGAISMVGAVLGEHRFYFGIANDAHMVLHTYLVRIFFHLGLVFYEITGGMEMLPRAFLPSLQDDIIYNARVNHIVHGNGSVVAHYLSSGKDVHTSADYLLTTATATSTGFIKFTPELSSDKREAFRNVHYIGATKIALVFEKPFWEDDGIHGGESITDLLSHIVHYPSHEFDSGLGVLIASYISADKSNRFLGLTDAECLSQALDDLAQVHGDHIKELYVEGVVKRWSLDHFSVGGYAAFTPYQLTNYRGPIVRPTNELFFAGEHTSYPHGWVDTAIKSAIEAVHCISVKR
ncbi:L-amino-acid oxidase-like [Amphiura filiformis]|uniref:L-amino-acid oxidase-like n=1 Tax=Amphiura filiformis TaxID=82378 RepID=UPI003B217F62